VHTSARLAEVESWWLFVHEIHDSVPGIGKTGLD
jgi:hypothetical protein